jgi:hypothetical protein
VFLENSNIKKILKKIFINIIRNIIFIRKLKLKDIYYIIYLIVYYNLKNPKIRFL